ncbi:hypothetical protein SAMN05877753_10394 [Bacillus oleivorans]|uniref:SMEK domain-containing protein n=1 Tax=Bacillus oleivorans TaxID=1448271 RepID=A0A285CPK9_9BACI|nr:ABC-three component system protein [Bacillus oleivorans]SNX69520.1 hypothetical protein SAMN05877753_10394 [Bacillus oleivorans]
MKRDIYFSYISEKIEILSYRINSMGKLNILNLNIHAEFFYRDLCNLIYGLRLENANTDKQNIAAIDLIDKNKKILIQVSATCTKKKINDTLSKDNLVEYKNHGYKLKFLFFSDAKNLRKNTFTNKHNIAFNPKEDIMDKETLLNDILKCKIDNQQEIFELVKAELGEKPDPNKISSNLAEIINLLSEEDLASKPQSNKLHEFNINKKIEHNNLLKIKKLIDTHKIHFTKVDGIYREFDKQGNNKSLSVFNKLTGFYTQEIIKENCSESQIFINIINNTITHIQESENYNKIPIEELEQCVSIIVVDAFIRCKIFENPEGYSYVTA